MVVKVQKEFAELRILLAEDIHINAFLAKTVLEKARHRVDVAQSGAEVLELLQAGEYDLILMDIEMPVMDGIQATRQIRNGGAGEQKRRIPIIAMTAHVLADVREACLEAGMNGFITKPIEISGLNAEISNVLQIWA